MEDIEFKIDPENDEQQKAFELVAYTNTSIFITGKAGTGKTTFIKGIQEEVNKRGRRERSFREESYCRRHG